MNKLVLIAICLGLAGCQSTGWTLPNPSQSAALACDAAVAAGVAGKMNSQQVAAACSLTQAAAATLIGHN